MTYLQSKSVKRYHSNKTIKIIKCEEKISNVLKEYTVGPAKVIIGLKSILSEENYPLIYCVDEPQIPQSLVYTIYSLAEALLAEGYTSLPHTSREVKSICREYKINCSVLKDYFIEIKYYTERELSGYGPLYTLMNDPYIEEITVDKPGMPVAVFHSLYPLTWLDTNVVLSESEIDDLVLSLSRRAGRTLSIAHPYTEGLLPEGHRIAATYGREISRFGSSIVIRKHRQKPISIIELVKQRVLSPLIAAYLWLLLDLKAPMLIVGPTASGKTTLLQALLGLIPASRRIVTIEDTPELNLIHHRRWDSLTTRYTYLSSEGEDIDLYKLAKFALRRRADYLVIGEIRGEEARLYIHAAVSGHDALATFHADTAESAILRLKAPPIEIGDAYIPALWSIIVVKRVHTPLEGIELRRVVAIKEIVEENSSWRLQTVFKWTPAKDVHEPREIEELLEKSKRLQTYSEHTNIGLETIKRELKVRTYHIMKMVNSNITDFEQVNNYITKLDIERTIITLVKAERGRGDAAKHPQC